MGDILEQEKDIFGDAVNLCARIEGITPSDEIYLSNSAYLSVTKKDINISYIGEFSFKGFKSKQKIYKINLEHNTVTISNAFIVLTDLENFGSIASNYENDVVFRVNPDETIDIIDEGVKLCNGMGFSPEETIFYSTDTIQKIIYKWDYNKSTREISNKRVFVKNDAPDQGLSDGMTVDSEGYVWSAIWWGSKVMRFDPDGKLEREIHIPASQTSCVMFGGKDLNELYVSTASFGAGSTELMGIEPEGYDLSTYRGGDLFRVKLDIQGKPEYKTNFNWWNIKITYILDMLL